MFGSDCAGSVRAGNGGITLADCTVQEGLCLWYQKYTPGDKMLEGLEKDAGEAKKGLWADSHPVPPWEWRKRWGMNESEKPPLPNWLYCNFRSIPPRIRLPARPLCPSRVVLIVVSLCNAL
jgi:hypothetical protein